MAKGGKREGAGRKKGVPNRATAEIKDIAREWGPAALKRIAEMAGLAPGEKGKADNEVSQLVALKEVLDRAYGKPKQEMDLKADVEHSFVARLPVVASREAWGKSQP